MKRTILWPPTVAGGRLLMTEDPDSDPRDPNVALRQIIGLALLGAESSNPWNTEGGRDPTYARNSAATRARLSSRVREVFAGLERTHRAKLVGVTFPADPDHPEALNVRIDYHNLETGGRASLELTRNG